ncbi:MAG: type II secretion system protein [Elusimicrobia bacterium]|nr:type II secretion system protein [Elusimicrobiota bacterium]
MNKKAFTLVELMIVMVIISLLASVAIPKFADIAKAAKQATAKHNLGVLKSVTSIYYSSNNGIWPYETYGKSNIDDYKLLTQTGHSLDSNAWVPTYMTKIPEFESGIPDAPNEGENNIIIAKNGKTFDYDSRLTASGVAGAWVFLYDTGQWYINCNATDTQGTGIHTW